MALWWYLGLDLFDRVPGHSTISQLRRRKLAFRKVFRYFMPRRRKSLEQRTQPEYREVLRLRQIWCEGTFAIQKRCRNLTQLLRRGREAAEDHCLLSAAALNLKRLIRNAD